MTPKVSVVVPCYNLGRYLDEAVGSVLAQTFTDFEILVVNDGSTDPETNRLLAGYRRDRTRVIESDNRGLSGARNRGIREARGAYVCALDADDLLEPEMLEKSVRALDAQPDVSFVSHWLRAFGDEAWDWTPERCDFPALLDCNTVNGAALVRREALLEVGLFDESMRDGCEDWDLWITMVERGHRGVILPEFLFRYRRRSDSMSRVMSRGGVNVELYRRIAAKHADSYRMHLEALALRRAGLIGDLAGHTEELRREEERWLGRELLKKREHAEALRGKTARVAHQQEKDARLGRILEMERAAAETAVALERSTARAEWLETRLAERQAALDAERAHGAQLEQRVDALARQVADEARRAENLEAAWWAARRDAEALRGSLSWKATRPIRILHAWLSRRGRKGTGS
jgi:glycosyltransferase involved in cell wall biosynthesis